MRSWLVPVVTLLMACGGKIAVDSTSDDPKKTVPTDRYDDPSDPSDPNDSDSVVKNGRPIPSRPPPGSPGSSGFSSSGGSGSVSSGDCGTVICNFTGGDSVECRTGMKPELSCSFQDGQGAVCMCDGNASKPIKVPQMSSSDTDLILAVWQKYCGGVCRSTPFPPPPIDAGR